MHCVFVLAAWSRQDDNATGVAHPAKRLATNGKMSRNRFMCRSNVALSVFEKLFPPLSDVERCFALPPRRILQATFHTLAIFWCRSTTHGILTFVTLADESNST